ANGVRIEDFIKAIGWCKEPGMRRALAALFQRAEDATTLVEILPAIDDKELIRKRLETLIENLPRTGDRTYSGDCRLLVATGQYSPATASSVFQRFARCANPAQCHMLCIAVEELKPKWDKEILRLLLDDKRETGWCYSVAPGRDDSLPSRVCDEAADSLA